MSDGRIERLRGETVFEGTTFVVGVERFRHADGEVVEREVVRRQDAAAIVAYDDEHVWLVRQPREAPGEPALLELPAGKLDEDGEDALATAKRELAEEIGKGAKTWRHLTTFYASPGFSDEQIHVYLATDLYDQSADSGENERIDIVRVPLAQLDDVIRENKDSKSLVGLLWMRAFGDAA